MPDDKSKTGGQDRARISTGEPYEVRDWARKFAVTEQQLLDAVRNVGNNAKDVEAYLKRVRQ
jgi:hypothetical protein